jgi:anti-sigma regulatory factor (Ser/Thr protein kinase)
VNAQGVDSVQTSLPGTAAAPHLARAFLRAALQTWALDGFGAVTELLTSELVSNVVTHVDGPMTLRARHAGSFLRVEVDDERYDAPVVEHPDPDDEHGWGMWLIDELASTWGTEQHADDGKTVWFELDIRTGEANAHSTGQESVGGSSA